MSHFFQMHLWKKTETEQWIKSCLFRGVLGDESYIGIVVNQSKDPYERTSLMESKSFFFVSQLAVVQHNHDNTKEVWSLCLASCDCCWSPPNVTNHCPYLIIFQRMRTVWWWVFFFLIFVSRRSPLNFFGCSSGWEKPRKTSGRRFKIMLCIGTWGTLFRIFTWTFSGQPKNYKDINHSTPTPAPRRDAFPFHREIS